MCTIVLKRGKGIVIAGLTHSEVTRLHVFAVALPPFHHELLGKVFSLFHTCTDREFEIDTDTARVVGWEEFTLDACCRNDSYSGNHEDKTTCEDCPTMAHSPVDALLIPLVEGVERLGDRSVESLEELALLLLEAEHL